MLQLYTCGQSYRGGIFRLGNGKNLVSILYSIFETTINLGLKTDSLTVLLYLNKTFCIIQYNIV